MIPNSPETTDAIEKIIEALDHIKNRPEMYASRRDDIHAIDMLLNGIAIGCWCLGYQYRSEIFFKVVKLHGYETSARVEALYEQMRAKGLSEEAIVQERIAMEIERWQLLSAEMATNTTSNVLNRR